MNLRQLTVLRRACILTLAAAFAVVFSACQHRDKRGMTPAQPIPLDVAAASINGNIDRIGATLRAVGSVDGHATVPRKGRRSYHLDGVLFYLAPQYFRFDLKKLGETQILIGSNLDTYWCFSKMDDQTVCGRHGVDEDLPDGIPARPDQLIDALGLTPVPISETLAASANAPDAPPRMRVVQRVVDQSQELLFLEYDATGKIRIEKEYWVDRNPPHLVRKVIFRDSEGVIEMQSSLDDYRRLGADGPMIAHLMTAEWPKLGSKMRFDIRKWTSEPQVVKTAVQFTTPPECKSSGR